ncbi:hypothetical protein I317_05448 [Kwoniella heveanensis CBS 569]|uniref:Uncharacterized protein n=1 Tax=Kwoniella heveanensis BCC8398 TaxID=1296120 RepID=A0A1B9GZB2_9TREE|nr:hypothetical protein I316_02224 [Kwoniella heveanensis BCC8398]OCF40753.1 hypothetical protein I317_05448 [Kwoniella heveanensis CBS 569]
MRPISPESTEFASASPLQSPRSSISSSHRSGMPLTPVYELDNVATDMVVTRRSAGSGGSGLEDAEKGSPRSERGLDKAMMNLIVDEKGGGNGDGSGRHSLPSLTVPIPSFGNYSFPPTASPASSSAPGSSPGIEVGRGSSPVSPGNGMSDEDIALPQAGFTFGTCPSTTFLGTPTAEQGPFEYPETSSSSSLSISPPLLPGSPTLGRRPSLALGMTHRRGSIVAHPHGFPVPPVIPSPPSTRRSSTCSTIVTLPVAGRRPSILHSATVESSVPQAQADLAGSPLEEIAPLPVSGPSSRRGSTLMFPHKPLLAPIPPSLLARRGSLPAAQLFGLPLTEQPNRLRASYSAGSHTTTTASLYHRRQSVASESGLSTGSGATVMDRDRGGNEQSQIRRESFTMRFATTPTSEVNPNTFPGTRRGSVSFFPPQYNSTTSTTSSNSSSSNSHQLHHQTPVRSSSISSRSSVASGSSGRSSFSSSRVPINFSPRHPNYHHTYHSNTTTTSVSRQNSLTRGGTSSSPSSPRPGSTSTSSSFSSTSSSSIAAGCRRIRHSSAAGVFLGHGGSGLSSSEESNEDEEEAEEELPTPSQSSLSVGTAAIGIRDAQSQGLDDGLPVPTGSGPTFVDPWSSTTSGITSGDEKVAAGLDSSIMAKGTYVPLETPPLETVHERPPLETVDSGATERP